MIIGIDANEANVKEKVGVSVYTFALLQYFQKKASLQNQFIIYLKDKPRSDLPKPNSFFHYRIITGDFLWSQIFLPISLYLKRDIDVFFSPAHYAPRFCPVPTVVAIHDLSYFYYPQEFLKKDLYQLKNWTKYSVKKAKKVIAVSKTTKKDLVKLYHIPKEKIIVIYNGFGDRTKSLKIKNLKLIKNWKLKIKNYILYVGTLQPRKNLNTLIDAFNLLLKEKPEYKLVIVGKKGWLYNKIFEKVKELRLENKVIFTGYLPDEQVTTLYKNASVFVLPSFYEGFGLPLLEAMSYDCPVIASNTASLPEIGDDACLYFDPHNPFKLKEKIKKVLDNGELRQELIKNGRKRVKLFSWERCGEKTLKLLKTVENDLDRL